MNVREEVARNLLFYRKKKGLTQKSLAGKLKVSHNTISQWESAINSIDIDMLRNVCEILEVSFNDMFGEYASVAFEQLNDGERKLIKNYRLLNEAGQDKAFEYIEDLVYTGKHSDVVYRIAARDGQKEILLTPEQRKEVERAVKEAKKGDNNDLF